MKRILTAVIAALAVMGLMGLIYFADGPASIPGRTGVLKNTRVALIHLVDLISAKKTRPTSGPRAISAQQQASEVRAEIASLKENRDLENAFLAGDRFIQANPQHPYSPLIALDLCLLTNHYASREALQYWIRYFEIKNPTNHSAGLANLKYNLVNACARDALYEESYVLGQELLRFTRRTNDPIGWGPSQQGSILNTMAVCAGVLGQQGQEGRLKTMEAAIYRENASERTPTSNQTSSANALNDDFDIFSTRPQVLIKGATAKTIQDATTAFFIGRGYSEHTRSTGEFIYQKPIPEDPATQVFRKCYQIRIAITRLQGDTIKVVGLPFNITDYGLATESETRVFAAYPQMQGFLEQIQTAIGRKW